MTLNTTTAPTHIHMHILDVCLSYIISRGRATRALSLLMLIDLSRGTDSRPEWNQTGRCGYSSVYSFHLRLLRMDDPSLTPHTAKNVLRWLHSVSLSLLREKGEKCTRWVSQAVYLIPFLTSSILFSLLLCYPFNPHLQKLIQKKELHEAVKRMHERWQLSVYISSSRRGRRGKGMILITPINMV